MLLHVHVHVDGIIILMYHHKLLSELKLKEMYAHQEYNV